MSLLLDAPNDVRGSQRPSVLSIPPAVSSAGDEAIELAASAGLLLDPWQQLVLRGSLGERQDGRWAAFGVGLCVPRQNGKGGLLEARELAGLFMLGERLIIHSAHQFDTSLEAFERLLALIDDTPHLRKQIKPRGVSRSHGTEGITLKSGQRIRFRTRTKGGGRGFTSDCLILDEAMIIPEAMLTALLPTLSARSLLSATGVQIWYTGSAVDKEVHEHGVVFARIRERGLRGDDPSLAYFEWSAADELAQVTTEMANDPEAWARANPALNIRISTEAVANERREFAGNLKGFAVERMGVGDWPATEGTSSIISNEAWMSCFDQDSRPQDPVTFAFTVSPDRSSTTIAVSGKRRDGLFHVEVVEKSPGTWWVLDRLAELTKKHRSGPVVCDFYGAAGSLEEDIKARHIRTRPVKSNEYAQACGMFFDAVTDTKTLRHLDTPELSGAVKGAATQPLTDAWKWSFKNSDIDISPLVACTLAHWGARTQRGRPMVINSTELLARAAQGEKESTEEPPAPPSAGPLTRSRWTVS